MCVIIDRNPGISIPADMLDLACGINKHGFGLSFLRKKSIVTIRETKDNDPKEIADLLQQHKDERVFLHLRHATKGEVILQNSHPFIGLGDTFGFMHNGTLYSWAGADKDPLSDSYYFFTKMLEPLAKMSHKFSGPDFIEKNEIFKRVVTDYCTGLSVFLIFDARGNVFRVNEKHGKQFEGWWASNDYSFRSSHHRATGGGSSLHDPFLGGSRVTQYPTYRGTTWTRPPSDLPAQPVRLEPSISMGNVKDFFDNAHKVLEGNQSDSRWNDKLFQCTCVGAYVEYTLKNPSKEVAMVGEIVMNTTLEARRTPFREMAKLQSLDDLKNMTETDLASCCENYPAAMAACIIDLLVERHRLQVMRAAESYDAA